MPPKRPGRTGDTGLYKFMEQDVFRIIHTFAERVQHRQEPPTLATFKSIFASNHAWFLFAVRIATTTSTTTVHHHIHRPIMASSCQINTPKHSFVWFSTVCATTTPKTLTQHALTSATASNPPSTTLHNPLPRQQQAPYQRYPPCHSPPRAAHPSTPPRCPQ